ncbi:MAG TPA: hypothetical protein VGG74_19190 [Kofleriaceae bacterium]
MPEIPDILGRVDLFAAFRAALVEAKLLLFGVALTLQAAAAQLRASLELAADERGGAHDEGAAEDDEQDVDAEHGAALEQ